jgi:MFS family permease
VTVAELLRRVRPKGALWHHPDFMKLWTGQAISEFGSQVSALAIPWIAVTTLNSSAFAVAALSAVEFLPFLLFTLPAGVWVDRLPRRSVLVVGDLGRAVLLLSIPAAYVADALTLVQLYVVGFLVGILTVFFDVAYQSYLPALVEREHLVEGNSKLQVTASGAQLAGPGVGGGLIQLVTAPYALFVDAVSFLVSGGFTAAIGKREDVAAREGGERRRLRTELWEGLRYVVRHPYLRPQAISTGVSNFFTNMGWAILLVYAHRKLGLSAGLVGLTFSLGAFGWMAGATFAPRLKSWLGVGGASLAGTALCGPAALLLPLAPKSFPLPFLIASGALMGFGSVVYNIQQVSLRQTITPARLQGRMNATMRFLVWGTIPLGALVGGALASTIGLRQTLFVSAAGAFLSTLPILLSPIRKLVDFPEPEADVPPLVAAGEGGLVPGAVGLDAGATAGAGPAASLEE